MNPAKYAALALAFAAAIALVYAVKPAYDELAMNNAALAEQLFKENTDKAATDAVLADPCFDESLRAVSCNDLLVAQAATASATP